MYYLLNSLYSKVWNKRIVCDKQLLDSYKERGIDYRGEPEIEIYQNPSGKLELHIIGKCKDDSKYIYANEGIVEKQSKNVFDLIEVGDLIKYQFINVYYELVSTIELVTKINIVFKHKEYISVLGKEIEKNKDILIIYKPNSNGDYIKVWEKKENE